MKTITNSNFDAERSFYGENNLHFTNCSFKGPTDGESAIKECSNIKIENCIFHLRYPLWHNDCLEILDSEMTSDCRAPIWYSEHLHIYNSKIHSVKALRECSDVHIQKCHIISPEFGWSVDGITVNDCFADGEYMFMRSNDLSFLNFDMKGKYSFQYISDAYFENCNFDTKDAFWHAENVTVKNSTIKGEYLGWYSKNLTLENCTISGTQPLCYCQNLTLIDCEMTDCDLSFEKSEVQATLTVPIHSIKNPLCGKIHVPSVDKIIFDESWAKGNIIISD